MPPVLRYTISRECGRISRCPILKSLFIWKANANILNFERPPWFLCLLLPVTFFSLATLITKIKNVKRSFIVSMKARISVFTIATGPTTAKKNALSTTQCLQVPRIPLLNTSVALNVSTDAPTYPSLNFFILMTFFFKSVYDFYFYNEIFADFMLPSARLVKEHFPDVHKFALENMPVRTQFDTERFEPNIPIRPVGQFTPNWKFWEWFIFTDSQVVIKNVLLACSRIQVYTNKHPMTESEKRWTVSQLSDHVKKLDNPALSDDSIAWEYAPLAF